MIQTVSESFLFQTHRSLGVLTLCVCVCTCVHAGSFCQSCLQECLRPQKPVCAVCRAGLGHWTRAAELEALIQSSRAACKGCGAQVGVTAIVPVRWLPMAPSLTRVLLTDPGGLGPDERPHGRLLQVPGVHRGGSEDDGKEPAGHHQVLHCRHCLICTTTVMQSSTVGFSSPTLWRANR